MTYYISDLYESTTMEYHSVRSAATSNPLYLGGDIPPSSKKDVSMSTNGDQLPEETAASECNLYEPYAEDNVYHEPDEINHDYANPDGIVPKNPIYGNL